jgi:hypothetical protein
MFELWLRGQASLCSAAQQTALLHIERNNTMAQLQIATTAALSTAHVALVTLVYPLAALAMLLLLLVF